MLAVGLLSLVEVTAMSMIAAPLNGGVETRELIYKVLLPYNLSSPLNYWSTFLHHSIGAIFYAAISIINDAMIAGFMLQVCSQLELLEHRIKQLPLYILNALESNMSDGMVWALERKLLAETVRHHVQIFRLVVIILYCSLNVYS